MKIKKHTKLVIEFGGLESECRKIVKEYLDKWNQLKGNSDYSFAVKCGMRVQSITRFVNGETSSKLDSIDKMMSFIKDNPL